MPSLGMKFMRGGEERFLPEPSGGYLGEPDVGFLDRERVRGRPDALEGQGEQPGVAGQEEEIEGKEEEVDGLAREEAAVQLLGRHLVKERGPITVLDHAYDAKPCER